MRRTTVRFIIILLLSMLLAGCTAGPDEAIASPAPSGSLGENSSSAQTLAPAAATEKPDVLPENAIQTAEEADPGEIAARSELPYLQRVEAGRGIYEGPGYEYDFVDSLAEGGTFTIVEEAEDAEGRLWGKLKSGIGWVDLTEINSLQYKAALISADYADGELLRQGNYHYYPGDASPYSVPIVFRADSDLRDVALFEIEVETAGEVQGSDLFTLPELTEDKPLIAELVFPGDLSMYGIRFEDESGLKHVFKIFLSGEDGSVIIREE